MKKLIASLAVVAVAGCSASPAPSTSVSSPEPTDDVETQYSIMVFEEDNGIDTSGWYKHITGKAIENGALWVYTDLSETAAAKELGSQICGSYAQYVEVDSQITVTFVRAESGLRLAKCGPGA